MDELSTARCELARARAAFKQDPTPSLSGVIRRLEGRVGYLVRTNPLRFQVEQTDTFAGEANYAWVRRHAIESPDTRRSILIRAKRVLGWTGLRCRVSDFGDLITIHPAGLNQVAFITLEPADENV